MASSKEYIIYYRGKIVGGIYDDRFLVKPTKSAKDLMPDAGMELPYEGAKEMILVDGIDSKAQKKLNSMLIKQGRKKGKNGIDCSVIYDCSIDWFSYRFKFSW